MSVKDPFSSSRYVCDVGNIFWEKEKLRDRCPAIKWNGSSGVFYQEKWCHIWRPTDTEWRSVCIFLWIFSCIVRHQRRSVSLMPSLLVAVFLAWKISVTITAKIAYSCGQFIFKPGQWNIMKIPSQCVLRWKYQYNCYISSILYLWKQIQKNIKINSFKILFNYPQEQ